MIVIVDGGGHLISSISSRPKVMFEFENDLLLSRLQSLGNELSDSGCTSACRLTIDSLANVLSHIVVTNCPTCSLPAKKEQGR